MYECWVVDTNGGAKDECLQVWANILFNCVCNWITAIVLFFSICFGEGTTSKYISALYVSFCYAIWTLVISVNITDNCQEKYEDDYPDLWTAFQLEFILCILKAVFILICILKAVFILIYIFITCCCCVACKEKKNNQDDIYHLSNKI